MENLTILGMFAQATLTVKVVMLALMAASFWSWSVVIARYLSFARIRRQITRFERLFWSGDPLEQLYQAVAQRPRSGAERIFVAGMAEWAASQTTDAGRISTHTLTRIDRSLNTAIGRETERLRSGLPVLATIGATTPFIGLFGTVIGIMNAFIEIAEQQNTNLAAVAPGIAEALLATGLGLFAAIPAVIFYNALGTASDRLLARYDNFADDFLNILSRQTDNE